MEDWEAPVLKLMFVKQTQQHKDTQNSWENYMYNGVWMRPPVLCLEGHSSLLFSGHAIDLYTAGSVLSYTSSANGNCVPLCVPPLSKLQTELEGDIACHWAKATQLPLSKHTSVHKPHITNKTWSKILKYL